MALTQPNEVCLLHVTMKYDLEPMHKCGCCLVSNWVEETIQSYNVSTLSTLKYAYTTCG